MTKTIEIAAYLSNCTTNTASGCATGTGLTAVHKRIFNNPKNVTKAEMIKNLSEFYADKKNIIDIWNTLNECEHDFITYIVQYDGKEYLQTTLEIAKKHNLTLEYKTSSGYKRNFLDYYEYSHLKFLHLLNQHFPATKTSLLFPSGKDIPPFVLAALQTVIKPMECEYKEYAPAKVDYIICRENRLGDFAALVRFAGCEPLKVKDGTYDITKAKLAKMSETIGFEEVCDKNGRFCSTKEAKRNNDFKVAPLLFALAVNSKLVDIDDEGNVLPGKQSTALLMMPSHEFAKKLFTDYARENIIHELRFISHITTYGGERWIKWRECRKPIFELLKNCPIDTFVKFEDFDTYAKIFYGHVFRQLLSYYIMIKGYTFGYDHWGSYNSNWDVCEAPIIRLILSFLSTIGMVDIAYTQNVPRIKHSTDNFCVGIAGFRITKLGAWILGMTDKYEAPPDVVVRNDEGELLVLPDYSIVISGLKCRIKHEMYLSRFLTKVSTDENASVYKLDFKSIVRAYDNGITPLKIEGYLKNASSKTLPDNVKRSLADWQAKVGRVKIRELVVLETDDVLLLEEIKHIKAMGDIIIGDLHHAAILVNDSKKKAKTVIEKNGWLVKI